MWWVLFYVGLGIAGIAVLLAFTVRLWRQVRTLGRTVSEASRKIGEASAALEQASAERR